MKKRINTLIEHLESSKYSFDKTGLLESSSVGKYVATISNGELKFILSFIPRENFLLEKNLLDEVNIAFFLKKASFNHAPQIVDYSPEGYWLIRQKISGKAAGDVYDFLPEVLSDEKSTEKMIDIVKSLHLLKGPDLKILSTAYLEENLSKYLKKYPEYKELIEKFIGKIRSKQKKLNDKSYDVFLHGDLQPTNFILTGKENLHLIDFETVATGNLYFDLASLYRRGEKNSEWQNDLLKLFYKLPKIEEKSFEQDVFDVYYFYFSVLEVITLDTGYIRKIAKPSHGTFLSPEEANKKREKYLLKLNNYLSSF